MQNQEYTMNYFFDALRQRVSMNNAKLLLHSAVVRSGMPIKMDAPMNKEDAKALCMELIKSGGPGFQVGRAIYSKIDA
jgi:DhnA family fructose-bisphosphate aldolase class Ia